MTAQFEFIAPDGTRINGTLESLPGTCGVFFTGPDPANDFDHDDQGTDVGYDSDSKSVVGTIVFCDHAGGEWLAHHLIPAGADALSAETLKLFAVETALGLALDTAMAGLEGLRNALKAIGSETPETSELITLLTCEAERVRIDARRSFVRRLQLQYIAAKASSIAAKERELKAQAEASPRVGCDNCSWTGRERDCKDIDHLEQRVAPGEIMPAGECPECGCLCHLLENEEA